MSWIKLDENFTENPKIIAAGYAAAMLYIAGLGYCARNQTDGFIPDVAVVGMLRSRRCPLLAHKLTTSGLWVVTEGGYFVHDYLEWQRSREQRDQHLKAGRERQQKWRNAVSNAVRNGAREEKRREDPLISPTEETKPMPPEWKKNVLDGLLNRMQS